MKLSRRLFLLSPLALAYKPSWGALSFPLPQGHFTPAKMPMHPVYPRPDNETQSHARHRWAHPDFRYEIPIGVQGGSWPFKYEIISGPTGATIGQYHGDPDYGVLKWTPASGDSGTKTFNVRVTDQELNTVNLTWTTTIDPTRFIFLDANNGSDATGDGSIGNPFATPASWHGAYKETVSYPDKIIVYRSGTYTLHRYDPTYDWVLIRNRTKPNQHMKYPDETPFIDCSVTGFASELDNTDLFISVDLGNTENQQVKAARCVMVNGEGDRVTLLGNISGLGRGLEGKGNPGGYYFPSKRRHHIFIRGNLSGANKAPMFVIYGGRYVLCENINLSGTYSWEQMLFIKSDSSDVTIRNVTCSDSFSCNRGVIELYGQEQHLRQENLEVCWCWIDGHLSDEGLSVVPNWSEHYAPPKRDIWIYRNTLKGRIHGNDNEQRVFIEKNIIISNTTPHILSSGGGREVSDIDNIFGRMNDGIIDSSGALSGSFRQQYLGIRGHEISSDRKTMPKRPPQFNVS